MIRTSTRRVADGQRVAATGWKPPRHGSGENHLGACG